MISVADKGSYCCRAHCVLVVALMLWSNVLQIAAAVGYGGADACGISDGCCVLCRLKGHDFMDCDHQGERQAGWHCNDPAGPAGPSLAASNSVKAIWTRLAPIEPLTVVGFAFGYCLLPLSLLPDKPPTPPP